MFLEHERHISLQAAARLVPSRDGEGVHPATVHRWARGGVRGHRLDTVLIGRIRYTSKEAIWRFIHALNGGALSAMTATPQPDPARVEQAEAVLKKAGLLRAPK